MTFIMNILYFLLFIIFISVLILIHELGHLAMAKAFKVYCFEFSIGMGPAIISKKRKNGETKVSLRAIPFGGYVSMYDDDSQLTEGLQIDESRKLSGIKKWKKALIMVAGVVMNLVLAIIIFFIAAWVPQKKFAPNAFTVNETAATALHIEQGSYAYECDELGSGLYVVDKQAIVHFEDSAETLNAFAVLNYGDFTFKKTAINDYLDFYTPMTATDNDGNDYVYISSESKINISKVDYIEFSFVLLSEDNPDNPIKTSLPITLHKSYDSKKEMYLYDDLSLDVYTVTIRCRSLGSAFATTFDNFGKGASIVVTSLKTLLTDTSSWSQAGGIVAVGFATSSTLENFGWSYFLYYWGVISVNLAIINILPFPGLDGWHLLVLAIEGITRKPIPSKVKNIVAFVGIAILFTFMILLLFKDVFTYIFAVGLSLL